MIPGLTLETSASIRLSPLDGGESWWIRAETSARGHRIALCHFADPAGPNPGAGALHELSPAEAVFLAYVLPLVTIWR